MSEEKIKILNMLNEGKITAEEAGELLKRVGSKGEHSSRYYHGNWGIPHPVFIPDYSMIREWCRTIWPIIIPIYAGLTLLGINIGGLVGFFSSAGWANILIGAGIGGMIGGTAALVCNCIILLVRRSRQQIDQ